MAAASRCPCPHPKCKWGPDDAQQPSRERRAVPYAPDTHGSASPMANQPCGGRRWPIPADGRAPRRVLANRMSSTRGPPPAPLPAGPAVLAGAVVQPLAVLGSPRRPRMVLRPCVDHCTVRLASSDSRPAMLSVSVLCFSPCPHVLQSPESGP